VRAAAGFLLLAAVIAVGPACAARGAGAPPVLLQSKPFRVEATFEDSGGLPWFMAEITVSGGGRSYVLPTAIRADSGGSAAALGELRRSMGWKDDFFFVRTSCGPGNAWKCVNEAVFESGDNGPVGLGRLSARAGEGYATCRVNGAFLDFDADFEINDLTSHAGAPGFDVVLLGKDGRLVGDPGATWARNERRFAANDSLAHAHVGPQSSGGREFWEPAITPRLENALIAKWCGRESLADSVVAEARGVLPGEIGAAFAKLVATVEPGALPRTSRLLPSPGE